MSGALTWRERDGFSLVWDAYCDDGRRLAMIIAGVNTIGVHRYETFGCFVGEKDRSIGQRSSLRDAETFCELVVADMMALEKFAKVVGDGKAQQF